MYELLYISPAPKSSCAASVHLIHLTWLATVEQASLKSVHRLQILPYHSFSGTEAILSIPLPAF